jgi:hypothetical protein
LGLSVVLIQAIARQPQEIIQGEFGLMPREPESTDAEILGGLVEMVPKGSPVQVEQLVGHGMPEREVPVRGAK